MKTDWRLQASHGRVGGKKRRLICNFPRENTHHLKKKKFHSILKNNNNREKKHTVDHSGYFAILSQHLW